MDKSAGNSVSWGTGGLGEPDKSFTGALVNPAVTQVLIGGQQTDANGTVCVTVDRNSGKWVTADAPAVQWCAFRLTPSLPRRIDLSVSHHPGISDRFDLGDFQRTFDDGARKLWTDSDYVIADSDPRLQVGGPGFDPCTCYHDDVPCYLDFAVFAPYAFVVFPNFGEGYNYQETRFLEITRGADLDTLEDLPISNIKVVLSMWLEGEAHSFPGTATLCQGTMVFSLPGSKNSTIVMHECGHAAGLRHPNESIPPVSCAIFNRKRPGKPCSGVGGRGGRMGG
jgi:hypothetical protein